MEKEAKLHANLHESITHACLTCTLTILAHTVDMTSPSGNVCQIVPSVIFRLLLLHFYVNYMVTEKKFAYISTQISTSN